MTARIWSWSYQFKSGREKKKGQKKQFSISLPTECMQLTYTCAKSASSTNPGYAFPSYSMHTYLIIIIRRIQKFSTVLFPTEWAQFACSAPLRFGCSIFSLFFLEWDTSLQALEHAGGSELCSAWVPMYGSAGMDNNT